MQRKEKRFKLVPLRAALLRLRCATKKESFGVVRCKAALLIVRCAKKENFSPLVACRSLSEVSFFVIVVPLPRGVSKGTQCPRFFRMLRMWNKCVI
jgi:hypothetical protein